MARQQLEFEDYNEEVNDDDDSDEDYQLGVSSEARPRKRHRQLEAGGTSSADSCPPRIHRRQSEVWRFYERHTDHTKTCRVCQRNFSTNTATGALRKHLEKHFGTQTDQVLSTAQAGVEVTVNPQDNTVTVSGLNTALPTGMEASSAPMGMQIPVQSQVQINNPLPSGSQASPRSRRLATKFQQQQVIHPSGPAASSFPIGVSNSIVTGAAVPVRARYKSSVWTWFAKLEDARPQCKQCGKIYSTTASTSGLQRHIDVHERKRKTQNSSAQVSTSGITSKQNPGVNCGVPGGVLGGVLGGKPLKVPQKTAAQQAAAELIFLKMAVKQHLSVAELVKGWSEQFKAFVGRTPNADVLHERLWDMFVKKREEVKRFLQELNSRISLSLELWTSAEKQTFLIVTAHAMSERWQPVRFVLDCLLLSPDTQTESVKNLLEGIMLEFGLNSDKLLAVCSGCEETCDAFLSLKLQLAFVPGPGIAHVTCLASALATCVLPVLKAVEDHISKIRRFIKSLFNGRKSRELQNAATLMMLEYQDLKLDTPGLWTSTLNMLETAVRMRNAIDDMVARNPGRFIDLSEDDWRLLELTVELIGNFQLAAQDLGKADYPTLSNVLPLIDFLAHGLIQQINSLDYPTWWRELAKQMLERTQKVLQELLMQDVYLFGTVLDPRHKLTTIPQQVNRQIVEENLRNVFSRYISDADTLAITTEMPSNPAGNNINGSGSASGFRAGSLMSAILKKNRESLIQQPNIDELNQYVNTAVELPDVDPLDYWQNHKKVYPHLAAMARDYMCIPATSAPSEQLLVKEENAGRLRNRLSECEILLYTCLNSWMDIDFTSKITPTTLIISVPASVA